MATGYVIFKSVSDFATFAESFSKANSGVCTPMTTSPSFLYFSAQASTYGTDRKQLMQEYVQKSMRTTLPLSCSRVSGAEFSHFTAPSKLGNVPSFANSTAARCAAV